MNSNNFINGVDIQNGKIVFNVIDLIANLPLSQQIDSLREDMLQINYSKRFTLDVGWRPDFDPNGYFIVKSNIRQRLGRPRI